MKVLLLRILLVFVSTFIGLTIGGGGGLFIAFVFHLINPSQPFVYLPMIAFGLGFGVYGLFKGIKAIYKY
jgi:hypothetical protein